MKNNLPSSIHNLPEEKLRLVMSVRDVVTSTEKNISEIVKWGLLTFTHEDALIAFICSCPGKNFIELGFFRGEELPHSELFIKSKTKSIRRIRIHPEEKIPTEEIQNLVTKSVQLSAEV